MSKSRKTGGPSRLRQERDPYVQAARRDGWRSRAVYKLKQIVDKERLLKPGMVCIDLGAAPGSWSQFVAHELQGNVRLIAVDLLPMDALPAVEFIQGDFSDNEVLEAILTKVADTPADLVLSDMAPNISGHKAVDQPRSMYLAELALDLAKKALKVNGDFVCKLFQGQGAKEFIATAKASFRTVRVVKPKASRPHSSEVYVVARNYHL